VERKRIDDKESHGKEKRGKFGKNKKEEKVTKIRRKQA